MHRLNEEHIQRIQDDIRQSGVYMPELEEDLLDHMCCSIEKGLEEGRDFEVAYALAKQEVAPEGLREIQDDTEFMIHLDFYKLMKRLLYGSGFITAVLFVLAALFNMLHLPGGPQLTLGSWGFLFATFIPTFIVYKVRESRRKSIFEKLTYLVGTVCSATLATGVFFKFMHWPGANVLNVSGTIALLVLFIPMLFFLLYRQSFSTVR